MASESEASCEEDPNFAVICAFFEKFGSLIGITDVDFCELQSMLENTYEVSPYLLDLHVKLLRKIKKTVHPEKWEKQIIKFCHTVSTQDAWELERFGYKKAKISSKLRILKELLEAQFDYNTKFKAEINKLTSKDLRSQPLGRDKFGHAYWFQSDDNYQIRIYKEDLDDEKWTLVAHDRTGLVNLINSLSDGDIKISSDSAGNEDSNSMSEKPIIDTGQQDTDSKKTSDDEELSQEKKTDEVKIDEVKNGEDEAKPKNEESKEDEVKSPKRAREDEDEGKLIQKFKIKNLEVVVSDISKTPVVGEGIEEEQVLVEGEGSGVDNESPIVGEAIEEDVMIFHGNGSGRDCETGNEPEEENKHTEEKSAASSKTKAENFNKVDESDAKLLTTEHVEEVEVGKKEFCEEVGKPEAKLVGKEQVGEDLKKEEPKMETKEDVITEPLKEDVKEEEASKNNSIDNKESFDNKSVNISESCKASETPLEDVLEEKTDLEHKMAPQNSQMSTDKNEENCVDRKLQGNPFKKPIIEPLCVKKVAYVCGQSEEEDKLVSEENKNGKSEDTEETIGDVEQVILKPGNNNEKGEESDEVSEENEENVDPLSSNGLEKDFEEEEQDEEEEDNEDPEVELVEPAQEKENSVEKNEKPLKETVKLQDNESNAQSTNKKNYESSAANSPAQMLSDSSVISVEEETNVVSEDKEAPSADPLAVSDHEEEEDKKASPVAKGATLSSFSLDFSEPTKPPAPVPFTPSPMRAVRKRGREDTSIKPREADNGPEKRMKLKGRRQVDTALRKSVEQRIEQLHGSSSDSKESEDDAEGQKPGRFKKKPGKKGRPKNTQSDDSDTKPQNAEKKTTEKKKHSRMLAGLGITEDSSNDRPALRQSRRIAQLKIKEQFEGKSRKSYAEDDLKKKGSDKNDKAEKRKRDKNFVEEEEEDSEPEALIEKKKKKKKEKPLNKLFNENRPWQSSTDDSDEAVEEEEEDEIIDEDDDAPLGEFKSDHEFSPESDIGEDDEEWQPMKRARTARKESDDEQVDDLPCQKCGKKDHPEWILLCDKCDNGWHCSCLRPPLLVIPEGDWFCPPCQHIILLEQLQVKLTEYDKKLNKKEIEDRRKERLAYVGISLNNVLPAKERVEHRKKKRRHSAEESDESSQSEEESESESESDSDEPIYQLRQRRQAKSYKFNEYDEMMKSAIGEEMDQPEDTAGNLGRGKDIQTIVKGLEPEPEAPKGEETEERPSVTNLKKMLRKKHRKLNSLDFDSEEEDISDEDFKGTSDASEEEEEEEEMESEESEDSDDCVGRKRRKNAPTRRSTRARTKRYDADFINDNSDDEPPKRRKKRSIWDESDTEESDLSSYGRRKRGKKKKNRRADDSDHSEPKKKSKPRIKYGGLTSSEEELGRGRRTRGKKATYVDTLGTDDSEEEEITKKNPRRIESDDDEDFVANEDEEGVEDDEEKEEVEEEDPESEEERREKRSLLVPKIYLKNKPMGAAKSKEMEPIKSKADEKVIDGSKFKESMEKTELKQGKPRINDINSGINENKGKLVELESQVNSKAKASGDEFEPKKVVGSSLLAQTLAKPNLLHEPIVSNVTALIRNDDENDDLSEPPGISLPLFEELASNIKNSAEVSVTDTPKGRRGRGPGKKKSLEETLTNISNKASAKGPRPAIEIAAPPQPFSQAQPTPSVITRMLQSKPGVSIYPVGRIRPKQFATMPDEDSDESSPKNSRNSSPAPVVNMGGPPPNQFIPGGARGPGMGPYRPHLPPPMGMNHYPRGPPPGIRPAPPQVRPPPHPYPHHPSHRPMDPSPSGGGPINLTESGPPPPSSSGGGPPVSRYPPITQAPPPIPGPRPPTVHLPPQQTYPPPPPSSSTSSAPPPPEGYYSNYPPPPPSEEVIPPAAYPDLPPDSSVLYQEPPYVGEEEPATNPGSDNSNGKTYEEESGGGEFAGLASYFSSQREDDLES